MKESVLKKMIEVVDTTMMFCKADFYKHDLARLCKADESVPFFWMVSEGGTSLLVLDKEGLLNTLRKDTARRFAFMRNRDGELKSFLYGSGRLFYFDGESLWPRNSKDNYKAKWNKFISPIYETIRDEYSFFEGEYWHKPRTVRFSSPEVAKHVYNLLHGEDGDGLRAILDSLQHWERFGIKDEVVISRDFDGKDLLFSCFRDGKQGINGGILFYDGKWHRHT